MNNFLYWYFAGSVIIGYFGLGVHYFIIKQFNLGCAMILLALAMVNLFQR